MCFIFSAFRPAHCDGPHDKTSYPDDMTGTSSSQVSKRASALSKNTAEDNLDDVAQLVEQRFRNPVGFPSCEGNKINADARKRRFMP
jgi:hypothetical protein